MFLMILSLFVALVSADEGMWPFNRLNREQLRQQHGFTVTDEWLNHVMRSSVRLSSGGSGSFVSADGLLLTNHHVAASVLEDLSTPQRNYLRDGFLATTLSQELPIPDLEVDQLMSIEDVTARVNAAVTPGMSAGQALLAQRAAIAQIERESQQATGLKSQVVTLYNGERFDLYRYKTYTEVRVVFAPEQSMAFFGGDPDNFEYPRYDLDMTLLRVYEQGRPARLEHYLRWSTQGAGANELVFVSGNPGRTSRLLTVAALEFVRDMQAPWTVDLLQRRERLVLSYGGQGEEQARQAKETLFGIQNSRKVWVGRLAGLRDDVILSGKRTEEAQVRARAAADSALAPNLQAWDVIAQARQTYRGFYHEYSLLEGAQGFYSRYFGFARTIARLVVEDPKPDGERLREFRQSNRNSLEIALYSPSPIYDGFEIIKLADSLRMLTENIGEGHELFPLVRQVMAGRTPETRARELVTGTQLRDVAVRRALVQGGVAAVEASTDPMIQLARLVDEVSRRLRHQFEEQVEGPEQQAYPNIVRVRFAIYGTSMYPDATFTPRLAYGLVQGYTERDGTVIPPWTTLGGAFEHETRHGAQDPWLLPPTWHQAQQSMNLSTPFNFVATADIIGGNSGSPVINRQGELVGLIFDGNIHSLVGDYIYDGTMNRSVSVHSAGMLEALRSVYHGDVVAEELVNGSRPQGLQPVAP